MVALVIAAFALLVGPAVLPRMLRWLRRRCRRWKKAHEERTSEHCRQVWEKWKDWSSFFNGYISTYASHFRHLSKGFEGYKLPNVQELRLKSSEISRLLKGEGAVRAAFNTMVEEVSNLPPPDTKDRAEVEAYAKTICAYTADERLDAAFHVIQRLVPEESK